MVPDEMLNDLKIEVFLRVKKIHTGVCVEATEQSFSCKLGVDISGLNWISNS